MATSDAFYIRLRDKADKIIHKFGKQFQKVSQGSFDPKTLTSLPTTSEPVWGILANDANTIRDLAGEVTGTWTASKTLILSAATKIKATDSIRVENQDYSLANIVTVKPADVIVVYLLDVS